LTAEPRADGWHALRMSPDAWTAVDDYLTESLVGVDPILDAAQHASSAAGLPPISVTAVQGKFLALLCHIAGARHVLEIGTLGGYSTIWLARGLPADGIVVSLEVSQQQAEVARANIDRAALPQQVEVIVGPALEPCLDWPSILARRSTWSSSTPTRRTCPATSRPRWSWPGRER
jgi:predicted O-methyltransferase YrrM